MVLPLKEELKYLDWSATKPIIFKDNLKSHIFINKKPFIPSWEQKNNCMAIMRPNMFYIMGMEYTRIWHKEHKYFVREQKRAERKKFKRMDINEFIRKLKERREKKFKCSRITPKVYGPDERIVRPPPVINYPPCRLVMKNYLRDRHITCSELTKLKLPQRSEKCKRNGMNPAFPFP